MKYSALGNVCVGIVCMMVIGCSNSELSTAPEAQVAVNDEQLEGKDVMESIQAPNLTTYLQHVEDKLGQLKDKHAKLVNTEPETGPGSKSRVILDTRLAELTQEGEEVQFQIEAMKAAKGEDQLALQTGIDKALADLDQSYDTALTEFAG